MHDINKATEISHVKSNLLNAVAWKAQPWSVQFNLHGQGAGSRKEGSQLHWWKAKAVVQDP